ncbi:hypothetical protein ND748_10105 [Frankia sp. AiPs1]|uniref:hypothetical protein n=1 Tax=Frankia sp. AiPs1 TaxID=573493 RepID=UPI00204358F1|nr:hypothetical protein [Frankia sp. AiPs1]MCM3922011.1 hypothetical protein [Frankia sp. AiPs1]
MAKAIDGAVAHGSGVPPEHGGEGGQVAAARGGRDRHILAIGFPLVTRLPARAFLALAICMEVLLVALVLAPINR